MALQWTPLRLSMVSGNNVSQVPRPSYRSYRKMADIGVQCEPQDSGLEFPFVNSTVAEINTSAEIAELDTTTSVTPPPQTTFHRPLSIESSTSSSSSGEERERRKPVTSEELDVDAICVQQNTTEDETTVGLNHKEAKTEPDGFVIQEKEEPSCGLDCLYFTMQCCECTIS